MMPPSFAQPTIVGQMVPGVTMVTLPRPYAADTIVGDHMGALSTPVSRGDLDALDASVGGTVAAYTQAMTGCAAMAPADLTAWNALRSTYTKVHENIASAESSWTAWLDPITQSFEYRDYYDQLAAIQQQLPTWQAKIKTVCGSAPPLPVPVAPVPVPGTPGAPSVDWSGTIKWVAIAAVVVAGVYFLSPIAMTAIAFVPKPREHAHA